MTKTERAYIRTLYNSGETDEEIAERFRLTVDEIRRWRRRNGLRANDGKGPRRQAGQGRYEY